jgi:hypothetical protein
MSVSYYGVIRVMVMSGALLACTPSTLPDDPVEPVYRVANLMGLDKEEDAKYEAYTLSEKAGTLIGSERINPAFKTMGSACDGIRRPRPCEEIWASIIDQANEKLVRVFIVENEYPTHPSGELDHYTCLKSKSSRDCYSSLAQSMAEAVVVHDTKCHLHGGKKCVFKDGRFLLPSE